MLNFKDQKNFINRTFKMKVKDVTCESFYEFRKKVYDNTDLKRYVWMEYNGNDIRGDMEMGVHDYFSLEYNMVAKIFEMASEILEQA